MEHERKGAIEREGNLNPRQQEVLDNSSAEDLAAAKITGVCNDSTIDDSATFIKSANEELVPGSSKINNCYITLGRDRRAATCSGYGGLGDTQCGAIDIVVGRHTKAFRSGEQLYTNTNFREDAARIYISQKTDIDDYLNIKQQPHSKALSGIAIKADDVRVVGRRTIKLVTYTDPHDSRGPKNGKIQSVGGIHLIAGNQTSTATDKYILGAVQPLVKGFNLNVLLERMIDYMIELSYLLDASLNKIIESWKYMVEHEHFGFYFTDTTISKELLKTIPNLQIQLVKKQKRELENWQMRLKNLKANWGLGSKQLPIAEYNKILNEGLWPHLSKWNLTN